MLQPTSMLAVLSSFTEIWSPHLVASISNHHIKVTKINREYI